MIGRKEIALMKPTAILVNTGRGALVDREALLGALAERRIMGAGLDVYHQEPLPPDDPLWTLPNVVLTPHTSGFRQGHWDHVIDLFSENLRRFLKGEEVAFRVLPELGY